MKRTTVSSASLAMLLALSAAPAQASDFTGMGTFLASIFGVVLLIVAGGIFGISFAAGEGAVRKTLRWAGLVIGLAVTIWWIIDPIAEGLALLIVLVLLFVALLVAVVGSKPPNSDAS